MKKLILFIFFAVVLSYAKAQSVWPLAGKQTHPWARWWWMGSAVDEKNIASLLETYSKAGFGGVEIAPIYGAKGYESRYLQYLSPEWMKMLNFSVQKAGSLGMGLDLTNGTGWPFGGPQVTPAYAATKLVVKELKVPVGRSIRQILDSAFANSNENSGTLQAVVLYDDKWNFIETLSANAQNDPYAPQKKMLQILAAFTGKTGQLVKRSAPGGAGFTMDHLSKEALNNYLKRFDEAFASKNLGVRSFFNDSYEVYFADYSPNLFNEFQQRRGYDVRDYLKELTGKDSNDFVRRIRTDYRETMSDMVLENFTQPWTKWVNSKGALSRNQAHGSPGNLLDLYATVDIPECETFGLTRFPIKGLNFYTNDTRNVPPDVLMLKFASSGANVMGNPLVSSETFTWLGEHFRVPLSHCKAEVEQVFLAGVNHVFYHGTTYSPEDAGWPGWLFYASVNFAPSNSQWPHLKGLNQYITRCQSVLQSGKSENELLVYWPVHDVWNDAPGKLDMQLGVHTINSWLQPTSFYKTSKSLMDAGYSVDFASDRMLANSKILAGKVSTSAKSLAYKVLIVPESKFMPLKTFQDIIRLAKAGAKVIMKKLPDDVPGYADQEIRLKQLKFALAELVFKNAGTGIREATIGKGSIVLSENVERALMYKGLKREELVDAGLKFIRRNVNGTRYYFVVNHTANDIDRKINLNTAGFVTIMDPLSGDYGTTASLVSGGKTSIRVQMASGASLILKVSPQKSAGLKSWKYLETSGKPMSVQGTWSLAFGEGGPTIPSAQTLNKLTSWTALPDSNAARFSGSADYQLSFNIPSKLPGEYLLQLGDVRESARIWINGVDAGILWSVPYNLRVGKYLKTGTNTLKIEVVNLMANRIRDLDRRKVIWRNYNEINFVNLFYQPFDAAQWDVQSSGLLGPVSITHYN